jgi:hypothetical protein
VADQTQLLEDLHTFAEHLKANTPPRQVSTHEYMQQMENRHKLERAVYMGGIQLRETDLSDEEVVLLNKLPAGRYNSDKWTVFERNTGGTRSIDIMIPNATQEDRVQLAIEAPSLVALVKKMLAELK